MGGSCHRGLRQGAEFLLEDAKDDLVKTLSENAGYRLVLCGHSLGGGARGPVLIEEKVWAMGAIIEGSKTS